MEQEALNDSWLTFDQPAAEAAQGGQTVTGRRDDKKVGGDPAVGQPAYQPVLVTDGARRQGHNFNLERSLEERIVRAELTL